MDELVRLYVQYKSKLTRPNKADGHKFYKQIVGCVTTKDVIAREHISHMHQPNYALERITNIMKIDKCKIHTTKK